MIINSKIFANDISLVAAQIDHIQSATILITVKVGSRDESSEVMGVSHFLEHMLFKGTKKYPTSKDVSYFIEELGGEINASTDREFTQYLIRVPNIYIEKALELFSEMFLYPKLDLEEFEKERMVILEELNMIYDQPAERCEQLLCKLVWPNVSLGCEIGGTVESISSIERKDLFDFMDQHYKADKIVISIVSPSKGMVSTSTGVLVIGSYDHAMPLAAIVSPTGPPAIPIGGSLSDLGLYGLWFSTSSSL